MPVIDIARWDLERLVEKSLSDEELENYLLRLKCEVEEINDDIVSYEATHDRPDLFSAEGLARALKGLLGIETGLKIFKTSNYRIKLLNDGPSYRPYVVGAVVEGLELDEESVKQLMNLQEKLHITYCRNRRKVSIGLYDLNKVVPPIKYTHVEPRAIKFVPLEETEEMYLDEILEKTEKGRIYADLIKEHKTYPLLIDSKGTVLSMPPIINSEDTKVTVDTKRVFIDATGIDLETLIKVLNILVTSTVERGKNARIGFVEILMKNGVLVTPRLEPEKMIFDPKIVEKLIGLRIENSQIVELLEKMRFKALPCGDKIEVWIPAYRIDIIHPVDIVEDVAMAYGYEELGYEISPPTGLGYIAPVERFSKRVREIMIGLQFQEVANYMMSNPIALAKKMRIKNAKIVQVENPKMEKYTALRNWIIPGLLEVLASNKHLGFPLRIFEIGDVAIVDETQETKTRIERRLGVVIYSEEATLTDAMVYVKALFNSLGIDYKVIEHDHPSFIEGRCGKIIVKNRDIGFLGEIHPEVIVNFNLEAPIAAFELNLTAILDLFF